MLKGYKPESPRLDDNETNEQTFVRSLFCVVLGHYMYSVKGGWQQLEETVNFLLMHYEQVCLFLCTVNNYLSFTLFSYLFNNPR